LTPNQQRLYIPVMASEEYKGFHVSAWARPEHGKGSASVGIACKPKPNGVNRQGGFICCAILPTLLRFSPSLWLRSFSRSLWRGLLRRRSLGIGALQNNTTGQFNTASGVSALLSNRFGDANTASGAFALFNNLTGNNNTASGVNALFNNATGFDNTVSGVQALDSNTTGSANIAIGTFADVSAGNLINATVIGFGATVNASNKIRLGNNSVTVIEGQVAFTAVSDKTKKENFQPVDGEAVLEKIRGFELSSWNFIGHDPKEFRHYGPMAQDFFAAFGHDGVGQIGSETTINSGDMAGILMIAVQALEKRTAELRQKEAQMACCNLKSKSYNRSEARLL
jgi:hypothetical protein